MLLKIEKDSLISNFGIFNQYLFVFVTIFQFLFSMPEYGIIFYQTEFKCFNLNLYLHVYDHDLAIIETWPISKIVKKLNFWI